MRTPYGQDCKYYYADFNRGRHEQACRLAEANPASEAWQPDVCRSCPVPEIVRANACQYLVLNGRVVKGLLGFGRKMVVEASCSKTKRTVSEPQIGCGECHGESPFAALFDDSDDRR